MNKEKAIKVSVILPIYKEPTDYINFSLESIFNQTFKDYEVVIVVDTGKESNEFERIYRDVVSKIEREEKVRVIINEKNIGLPLSLNRGIKEAKGNYICLMHADDIALPQRLEAQFEFLKTHPHYDFCGSPVYYIGENNEILGKSKFFTENEIIERLYIGISPIPHPTWFLKRKTFGEVGYYKNIFTVEDYEFLCRLILRNKKITMLKEPLLKYRISFRKNRLSTKRIIQLKATKIVAKNFRNKKETKEEEIERVKKSKPNLLFEKLDKFSMKLDMFFQSNFPRVHYYIKWLIYMISPYKALQIVEAAYYYFLVKIKKFLR